MRLRCSLRATNKQRPKPGSGLYPPGRGGGLMHALRGSETMTRSLTLVTANGTDHKLTSGPPTVFKDG